jgi:hypothetical protein
VSSVVVSFISLFCGLAGENSYWSPLEKNVNLINFSSGMFLLWFMGGLIVM